VKIAAALGLWLAVCSVAPAQTNELDLDDALDAVGQFARENLDPAVLQSLQAIDRDQVRDFLEHYQDHLRGNDVLDMAQLKAAAGVVLPLLEARDETRPYAAWLRERMDYFDVVEELKPVAPAPPQPGQPPAPPPNPPFKAERELWIRKVTPRPWPKGAAEIVPRLKTVFASEGVPPELVWLAEVESGFDAQARSPAGAAGVFQMMPAAAREHGLKLWPRDQRRQPVPEARAAARELRELHDQFGDWRLAVAAYNCGAGAVQKSLDRHHARSYERIATHLPAETQMYVPKVEATILHREGVELELLKAPAAPAHG
jgi:membrane-bound lytic murein transglycosylase D